MSSDREKEQWAQGGAESPDDADAGDRTSETPGTGWAKDTARNPDDADADAEAATDGQRSDKPSGIGGDAAKAQEDAARERERNGGYQ